MRAGNVLSVTSPYSAVVDPQDYMGHYTWDGYDHDGATNYFLNNARVYDPVSQRGVAGPDGLRRGRFESVSVCE